MKLFCNYLKKLPNYQYFPNYISYSIYLIKLCIYTNLTYQLFILTYILEINLLLLLSIPDLWIPSNTPTNSLAFIKSDNLRTLEIAVTIKNAY